MYRIKKGTNVILKCDPQTSNSQITELWWQTFKSGHFRNLTNNWKYSGGNITSPNLQIQTVSSSEVAEYFCNVANQFGRSHVGMEVELGSMIWYNTVLILIYHIK